MKPFKEVLPSIHKIVTDFDGAVAFKNSRRQYFFVNDKWLSLTNLKKEDVIGKTADEFMPAENAMLTNKTDLDAIEQNIPIEYIHDIILNGKPFSYISVKWVINFTDNDPFFICNLSALLAEKEKVLIFRKNIDSFFEKGE